MTWHHHPDASAIVRRHWKDAQAFLVAQREPCIRIRDGEVQNVDRLLIGGFPEDLQHWQRPASSFIAVILCPGDDTQALAEHVQAHDLDPSRIHFYLHPDTPIQAMQAWAEGGLPLDRIDDEGIGGKPLDDWKTLHKLLGLHFNMQILHDFA